MATLNQLVYDITSTLRGGGLISDDEPVSPRLAAFWIQGIRATLIRQQMDKGQSLSTNISQTLQCVPVHQVDISGNPNITTDCYIVETVTPLPKAIETSSGDLVLSIGLPGYGTLNFTKLPEAAAPYSDYNPFGKNTPKVFTSPGNKLVVKNLKFPVADITVSGVFEEPEAAAEYGKCDGDSTPCFDWDTEYPMSAHMIGLMKKMILDTEYRPMIMAPHDNVNNAAGEMTSGMPNNTPQQ